LGLAALEDNIVQPILNEIYEVDFRGFSALNAGIQRRRVNWIPGADIRGSYHEWTMKFVEHRVADRRPLRLIRKWLKDIFRGNAGTGRFSSLAPQVGLEPTLVTCQELSKWPPYHTRSRPTCRRSLAAARPTAGSRGAEPGLAPSPVA